MKRFIISLFALLLFGAEAFSQVGIYPQAVFLSPKNRSSNLKVINSNDQIKEIQIEMKFGYPGLDSLGKSTMIVGDTLPEAKEYSAVPYVKVFPKRLILKGKEEQTVRFMLGNTAGLNDGTYFGRILIISKNPPEEIDTTTKTDKITAKIDIQFTLMSALIVEKGKRDCILRITGNGVYTDSANVNIFVNIEKTGNSPFLGTAELNIFDNDGNKVEAKKEMSPIYFSSKKAFKIEKSKFKNGKYKVELKMTNEHKDVPDDFKVPFEPLNTTFYIDLNGKLQ
jgi:hypothetical protein